MRSREAISIAAFAVVLVVGCVAAALAPFIQESYERPDPAKMRAYRMSLLTDPQVLELHARAVREVDRRREQKIEAEKASNAEEDANVDNVRQTRLGSCGTRSIAPSRSTLAILDSTNPLNRSLRTM